MTGGIQRKELMFMFILELPVQMAERFLVFSSKSLLRSFSIRLQTNGSTLYGMQNMMKLLCKLIIPWKKYHGILVKGSRMNQNNSKCHSDLQTLFPMTWFLSTSCIEMARRCYRLCMRRIIFLLLCFVKFLILLFWETLLDYWC